MGLERARGEGLEGVHGLGDIGFGAGEFDEDVGIASGDDCAEEGVVGARGFGATEGWAVEVSAVSDNEGDFFIACREFFAF